MTDRRHLRLILVALLAGTGSSCTKREPDGLICAIGSQGCPCTEGGGCDPGLACATGTCTPVSVDDERERPEPVMLDLPRTDAAPAAKLVVSCTKEGNVYLGNRVVDDDDELARLLTEIAQANPNLQGIVKCDAEAPYARVTELIDMLRSAGIRNYTIPTDPQDDEPRPTPPEAFPSR